MFKLVLYTLDYKHCPTLFEDYSKGQTLDFRVRDFCSGFVMSCYPHSIWHKSMRCQVGKKHLLFTYMGIIFSLMGVIFYHIGTT